MHSRQRTIDDMMCISDGCDPHHYIKGRGMIGGMAKMTGDKVDIRPSNYGFTGKEFQNIKSGDSTRENAFIKEYETNYLLNNELVDALNDEEELPAWVKKYMDDHKITDPEEIKNLLDDEENRIGFLSHKHGYKLPKLERKELNDKEESEKEDEEEPEKEESEKDDEEENESESEEESEEDKGDVYSGIDTDEDEEMIQAEEDYINAHGDKLVRYRNNFYIDEKKRIQDDDSVPKNKKDSALGESLEEELDKYPGLMNYIFNNTNIEPIINSSNINNNLYKPNFKKYVEKSNKDNASEINKGSLKPKLDYYLCDFFIGNNELCELKCLSKSYEWYVRSGYIPLTVTKIDGDPSEFVPRYGKDASGNIMVKNIYYKPSYNSEYETSLKDDWFSYKILYFLKDGVYYYEPLKDPHFKFNIRKGNNDATGKLDYTFTYKKDNNNNYIHQNGKKVPKEYNIDPKQLKQVPKHIYNKLFKNNNI